MGVRKVLCSTYSAKSHHHVDGTWTKRRNSDSTPTTCAKTPSFARTSSRHLPSTSAESCRPTHDLHDQQLLTHRKLPKQHRAGMHCARGNSTSHETNIRGLVTHDSNNSTLLPSFTYHSKQQTFSGT